MQINNKNFKHFTVLALVLGVISTVIAYTLFILFQNQISKLPLILQIIISIPSVPGVYVTLFSIFDKYLWKWKFFRYLGIITADDLNGTWEGVVKSSWDHYKSAIPAELKITQTATAIKISGKFNQSRSVSVHEYFGKHDTFNQTALYYFYKNDPNYDAVETMATHEGSAILAYDRKNDTLAGYYYSGRDRHNNGTISVKRTREVLDN